jgi:hypothetical protein
MNDEDLLDIARKARLYGDVSADGGASRGLKQLYLSGLLGVEMPVYDGLLSAEVGGGYGMGRASGDGYDVRWNRGGVNNLGLGFAHPKYGDFRLSTNPNLDGAMFRYSQRF